MRDRSDRYQTQSVSNLQPPMKKLGSYLLDAGLLTVDQIKVVLTDQQATGMRFGEILVARGWMKEQTIEWIVSKVVEPERRAVKQKEVARLQESQSAYSTRSGQASSRTTAQSTTQNGVARSAIKAAPAASPSSNQSATPNPKPYVRREVPISKPLPSVGSSDGDVNWVG